MSFRYRVEFEPGLTKFLEKMVHLLMPPIAIGNHLHYFLLCLSPQRYFS